MRALCFCLVGLTLCASVLRAEDFMASGICYHIAGHNRVTVQLVNGGDKDTIRIPTTVLFRGEAWNVTEVSHYAFRQCPDVKCITIPPSCLAISEDAFYGTESLCSIHVHDANTRYRDLDGVLYTKALDTIVCYPRYRDDCQYDVAATVTHIGRNAFCQSKKLKHIQLPSGLRTIGNAAFYGCDSLEHIVLPSALVHISSYAFWQCLRLESLEVLCPAECLLQDNVFSYFTQKKCKLLIPSESAGLPFLYKHWEAFDHMIVK